VEGRSTGVRGAGGLARGGTRFTGGAGGLAGYGIVILYPGYGMAGYIYIRVM
jgi:hypothetical protein